MTRSGIIETNIPQRLDRLPWSRFHWLVVVALGITWILDGLEVTLTGSLAGVLQSRDGLSLSDGQIGTAASTYLVGAVSGALGFGYLTDRLGRKKLFFVTLGLYLAATAATAFSWDALSFMVFRFLTGAGIGGEYAAINSAIQELIPARFRGRTDLAINGSYWFGAAAGAGVTVFLLDPRLFPPDIGWRVAFGTGAVLGLGILLLRRFLPESPRWLMIHGDVPGAEAIVGEIEGRIRDSAGTLPPVPEGHLRLRVQGHVGLGAVAVALFRTYPRRAFLALALMGAQAFLYNAIFFTYALVISRFFQVPAGKVGLYLLPFSITNAIGPLLLGPLFDIVGRKPMIAATYAISGLVLAAGGWMFAGGGLSAITLTALFSVVFFFASPAASAAYLTVGESFPLETRAMAIAIFYALGTAIGGVAGPVVFGHLIGAGGRQPLFHGYMFAAALMVGAALIELALGIRSERQPLESVAAPLGSE
jgi:MFS family permease